MIDLEMRVWHALDQIYEEETKPLLAFSTSVIIERLRKTHPEFSSVSDDALELCIDSWLYET